MAKPSSEIFNVCRLCLCQDDDHLSPINLIIPAFSTENIQQFAGIQLNADDNISSAMCFDCITRLRASISFHNSCVSNDALFKQLREVLVASKANMPEGSEQVERKSRTCKMVLRNSTKSSNENSDKQSDAPANGQTEPTDCSKENIEQDNINSIKLEPLDSSHSSQKDHMDRSDDVSNDPVGSPNSSQEDHMDRFDDLSNDANTDMKQSDIDKERKEESKNKKKQSIKPKSKTNRSQHANREKKLCNICGKMVYDLTLHMQGHSKDTKHACPHCPAKITHQTNLLHHIRAVHLKTISKCCEICGKGFTHNALYKSHMRAVHGIGEKYECKICSKQFNHPGGLRDHNYRFHRTEYKFECKTCGKPFKIKQDMRVHERVHSKEQPYVCNICDKRFKSQTAHKAHILTHSGASFKCKFCDKFYRRSSLLWLHVKKIHKTESATGTDNRHDDALNDDKLASPAQITLGNNE